MKTLKTLIDRLTKLDDFIFNETKRFFIENESIILGMQRGQMLDNVNSKGESMGTYSPKTIEIKKAKGTYYGNDVILKDTGKLQEKLKVIVEGSEVFIDSLVPYFEKVVDIYNPIGLDELSQNKLKIKYLEYIIPIINNYIGK